ncbi:MAG: hypothetical protein J6Y78_11210 [Paludibacteraceae bacterium]|nr:hypothetical protein [Paludibacteraceae bacterium]
MENLQIQVSRKNKEQRKLLKQVRKMKEGDEVKLHDYDVICFDKEFYLLINAREGIFEKHYNEIKEWIIYGGELD